ncbi:MAG: phosphate ABC transporter permease subunit PstC [Anaerolineae bacterium]|uniref:phosphate ABC transporter permease subunit PstC n=1 Tax=Thermoflexus sp. TaxID=1969742 RepID=UPI002994AF30|nr:phosphate ABC transporter permease subunit PstC [Anaerolineae bacterium]MDW8180059.1 phosphate ABC transporter permease subunit PstC [Anaerolineae bacterium]MDW8184024.1 phosphate ABC transporter permease subunit PstC [Anaerolineae bacterium]
MAARWREWGELAIQGLLFFAALVSVFTTMGIVVVLLVEALPFFQQVSLVQFLTDTQWTPLFAQKRFGIAPLLAGTLLTSAVALALAIPVGLLSAIYLSEYAPARVRATVKPILEILAGIPTVVYGYFALLFVTPLLKRVIPNLETFNALSAGLTMGIMIIPLVSSLSEDALYAVPNSLREAAYALGATRLEVALRVAVPAALSGIVASFILAASRAIGETMIVAIAAGQRPILTLDPRRAIETMTAYIVQVSLGDTPHGTLEFRTIFAVGLVLFLFTLVLNVIAIRIIQRYREVYR